MYGCNNTKTISGKHYVGGIVGEFISSTHLNFSALENCNNSGTIISSGYGETRGYNYDGMVGEKWQNIGTGGIIGFAIKVIVKNATNSGEIKYINIHKMLILVFTIKHQLENYLLE